jgi:hypothetical protein
MNPTLPQSVVDDALAEDLAAAKADYLVEFRDDVSTFLPRDIIQGCVVPGRLQLSPNKGTKYASFVDLSGGRSDDAALAIAHKDEGKVILDFIKRWKPPFNPNRVIGEMCDELRDYGISRVIGDNYSAEFTKSGFESHGFQYARATTNPWSSNPTNKVAKPKSQLYLELLPRLCSGEIEMLDHDILVSQLSSLERRTRSGGRDTIDHATNQHDDLANVVAGVADIVFKTPKPIMAYSIGPHGVFPDSGKSRSEYDLQRFERRREELQREQAWLAEPNDDQEEFRELMFRCGRTDRRFK